MTVTIDDFETELRSYIGTPFHHGGRVPGLNGGLDCGGMVIVAMTKTGMTVKDVSNYPEGDGIDMLTRVLSIHCERKDAASIEPGDLIVLRDRTMYHHILYWTQAGTVIHAWQTPSVNKVVETEMIQAWWAMVDSVWHIRELENWQQ